MLEILRLYYAPLKDDRVVVHRYFRFTVSLFHLKALLRSFDSPIHRF